MFESFLNNSYWLMLLQVIVTLLILPKLNSRFMMRSMEGYIKEYYPEAKTEVDKYSIRKLRTYKIIARVCLAFGLSVVLLAIITGTELFNWDNQVGLLVLFFIGFAPILVLALVQKGIFEIFERYVGNKRSATLKQRTWRQYFPKSMILLLGVGQLSFIVAIIYFMQYPFEGFAGLINLGALLLINVVFLAGSYVIITNSQMSSIKDLHQREAIIAKRMKINLIAWIIAVFHISASMWLANLDLKDYSLVLQSLYLQLVLCITAYGLAPVSLTDNSKLA